MTAQTDLGVSERVQGSGYINVRCPADGRVVGNVPDMTPGQVHEVARQLRAAQPRGKTSARTAEPSTSCGCSTGCLTTSRKGKNCEG
jgi:hypothetical protein